LYHLVAVFRGREEVASRSEVPGNGTIGGEEALGVARGFKPLHPPHALTGRLVGILGAVVEIAVLAMLHTREHFPLGRTIAFELIRDDDPRDVHQPLQQLAKELLRGVLVSPPLHQDIQHVAVLIGRPPQIMAFVVDGVCSEYV
jgi:hypothetical protein